MFVYVCVRACMRVCVCVRVVRACGACVRVFVSNVVSFLCVELFSCSARCNGELTCKMGL